MSKIVGIDEVGRGPLAGPVTVCVVVCDNKIYKKLKLNKNLPPMGKDSKKLKEKQRIGYCKYLKTLKKEGEIDFSINHVSNIMIDSKGISFAIKRAIDLGVKKLKLNPENCEIRLDGGLKVSKDFKQKTIIRGDEKEKIIAWASILAKVSRDNLMIKIAKKYPKYAFEIHKGYGTKKHREVIKKHGLVSIHRVSFCKNAG